MRVLSWNIERGYRTAALVEELKRAKADVVLLQEVDIGWVVVAQDSAPLVLTSRSCDRTQQEDIGLLLAHHTGMRHYAFVTEFEETWSTTRSAALQGASYSGLLWWCTDQWCTGGGCHGNGRKRCSICSELVDIGEKMVNNEQYLLRVGDKDGE